MQQQSKSILGFILLLLLVTISYREHFSNGFYFDDTHTIQNNLAIRSLDNISSFFTDASTSSALPANQSYRPIVTLSLAIDYAVAGGLVAEVFHCSTFLLFLLILALCFILFRKLTLAGGADLPANSIALAATALYGLHTANAETLNYIIARSDIISTFFVLLAVLLFMQPTLRRYHLYLLPAALGMLTKEAAFVTGAICAAYFYFFESDTDSSGKPQALDIASLARAIKVALPALFLAALIFCINRAVATTWTPGGASRLLYLATQPWVVCHYVLTFFAPLWLSADTDWSVFQSIANWRTILGSAIVASLLWFALYCRTRPNWRPIGFGLLWFFIALIPTSSIIPLSEVLNDHRTFFPYIGLALALCTSVANTVQLNSTFSKLLAVLCMASLFVAHSLGVQARTKVWSSDYSLWLDVTQKSPDNARGLMNFGLTLMAQSRYEDARYYFEKTERILPNYPYVHINLGVLHGNTGQDSLAERYFNRALQLAPNLPESYYYYARFLSVRRRFVEAEELLKTCIAISPAYVYPRQLLLSNLALQARWKDVAEAAQAILKLAPQDVSAKSYLLAAQQQQQR